MLVLTLPLSLAARPPLAAMPQVSLGVLAGLRWLAGHRLLRTLAVATAAVAAADSAWFAILVLYAKNHLGTGVVGFGFLLTVGALGGLLGSFVADRLVAGRRHRMVLAWTLAVAGIPAMLAVTSQLWAAILVIVVTSGSFAVLNVTAVSLRQRTGCARAARSSGGRGPRPDLQRRGRGGVARWGVDLGDRNRSTVSCSGARRGRGHHGVVGRVPARAQRHVNSIERTDGVVEGLDMSLTTNASAGEVGR
jgi:hypothetical protein